MTYSKYPNWVLKIICINLINHFDVWVPHKWKKTFLAIFPHAILYWNITKHPDFKKILIGNEKWILCKNMEWKGMWGKWNEPPPTTPKANLHPEKVMLCIWWNWKGVLSYELLPENQMINSNKYIQLDQLKAALALSWISQQKMHNLPSG